MLRESEHEDDASGEFEHVNTCQHDTASSIGAAASENVKIPLDIPIGVFVAPLLLDKAQLTWEALKIILCPPCTSHTQHGGYKDPQLDPYLWTCLEEMKQFLWTYINPQSIMYNKWTAASLHTANYLEKKPYHA